MIGRTLGHYRLVEKLGEGGMGVVYRAQDTRLGRDVAIKALTDAFARDPERLARFQREAQALAALNHSNIAAIHGFEEYEGRWFLVMEYVPGEVLRGPLPVDEALHACRQIADALEAAHEKGIVHRDLKPANIKLTPEGKIKVLDFGLARIVSETAESNETATALSPAATRAGVVMGTAAYMSPEQARGKPVDKRADIWAFGCVLYELLAGRQAFSGETISDMMASVLKSEPDWNALPPGSPVRLLRRCLEKDPARRLRDIGDARFDWEEPDSEGPAISTPVAAPVTPRQLRWAPWILAALLAGVAAWGWLHSSPGSGPLPVARVIVPMPPKEALDLYQQSAVALSPRVAGQVPQFFGEGRHEGRSVAAISRSAWRNCLVRQEVRNLTNALKRQDVLLECAELRIALAEAIEQCIHIAEVDAFCAQRVGLRLRRRQLDAWFGRGDLSGQRGNPIDEHQQRLDAGLRNSATSLSMRSEYILDLMRGISDVTLLDHTCGPFQGMGNPQQLGDGGGRVGAFLEGERVTPQLLSELAGFDTKILIRVLRHQIMRPACVPVRAAAGHSTKRQAATPYVVSARSWSPFRG